MNNKCPQCRQGTIFTVNTVDGFYRRQCYSCQWEQIVPNERTQVIRYHFADRRKLEELKETDLVGSDQQCIRIVMAKVNEVIRRQDEKF